MAKLQLFKVGANGRIALTGIAKEGDHFTAETAQDGAIILTPVEVVTTSTKRPATDEDVPPFD
jgi:hypothetical protein